LFEKAWDMIEEQKLIESSFRSEWVDNNTFEYVFKNDTRKLIIKLDEYSVDFVEQMP